MGAKPAAHSHRLRFGLPSDRERDERRMDGMVANMEQQCAAGMEIRFHSTPTRGAPPHYPHTTADSEHGPPLSENDQVSMISTRPTEEWPSQTRRECRKGKAG